MSVIKKRRTDKVEKYRVAESNVFSKLYGSILKYLLEEQCEVMEDEKQAGFSSGRSTVDHIFCLKQTVEKRRAFNLSYI